MEEIPQAVVGAGLLVVRVDGLEALAAVGDEVALVAVGQLAAVDGQVFPFSLHPFRK